MREVFRDRNCSFRFKPVKQEDVMKIISRLKNSKSSGVDYIDTATLKLVAREILPAITHIINLSISQGTFPTIWKHSKVIPLLKKGDPLSAKNYRPVALLPILSKILEKAVFIQIVEYLEQNKLLHHNHHGSRSGYNTATALIQMYDQWTQEVDDGRMVGVMMIDLSAAFDMVDHHFGVPQGSILGPLMYIIFTNEIPDLVHSHPVSHKNPEPACLMTCGSTVCYVDDGTFSVGHKDSSILSQKLSEQCSIIADYMAANKLVINADKTHLVVMGTKATAAHRADVMLEAGPHTISPTPTERLLGCQISQDLKWKQHILEGDQSLVKQLTSRINGLCMMSDRASMSTRLMVANGIVMSKLCYLIQLWGGCDGYLLKHLQVLQNRAARSVTGCGWFTPKRKLMKMCKWLSINQLVFYQAVVMAHKIVLTSSPYHLASKMSTTHPRETRQSTSGCIRFGENFSANQAPVQKSFCHRATGQYNTIPASLRSERSMPSFKLKLKKWVESNIPVD